MNFSRRINPSSNANAFISKWPTGVAPGVRPVGLGTLLALVAIAFTAPALVAEEPAPPPAQVPSEPVARVAQLVEGNPLHRNFPTALPTLLQHMQEVSTVALDLDPVFISSFDDERLFQFPIVYVNFGDREDWNLSRSEMDNLKAYLDRGGFLYIDAGITSEFLRGNAHHGQHHSFADWEAHPALEEFFRELYPDREFERVSRSHPIFRIFHSELPSPDDLPETVVDYVVNEKWPEATYSFLKLEIDGRVAVLTSPIVAMGWGRNHLGEWDNPIAFRVRESGEGLADQLQEAAYAGERFEAVREDGRNDVIYSQEPGRPSWVQEPDGNWRIFRYYHSREISDYAHTFYTQLGVNVFLYALTH